MCANTPFTPGARSSEDYYEKNNLLCERVFFIYKNVSARTHEEVFALGDDNGDDTFILPIVL